MPLAPPTAPMPSAFVNVTTVSDWLKVPLAGVDDTVTLVSAAGAFAAQISDVPACVLTRLTSVHARPAPVTLRVCTPGDGPSDATNATSSSFADDVLNDAVVREPRPSLNTVLSTIGVGGGGGADGPDEITSDT